VLIVKFSDTTRIRIPKQIQWFCKGQAPRDYIFIPSWHKILLIRKPDLFYAIKSLSLKYNSCNGLLTWIFVLKVSGLRQQRCHWNLPTVQSGGAKISQVCRGGSTQVQGLPGERLNFLPNNIFCRVFGLWASLGFRISGSSIAKMSFWYGPWFELF